MMNFATLCRERAKSDRGMRDTVAVLPSSDWDYKTAMGIILIANEPHLAKTIKTLELIAARKDYMNEIEGRNIAIDRQYPLLEVEVPYLEEILIKPTDEYLAAHMPEVCDLFLMFYEAFVENGTVSQYGNLKADMDASMIA
jgi:hypothetical protein